jgi:competence protein ComEC
MSSINERWAEFCKAQAPHRFLWLASCFMAGIASYYALPVEPPTYGLLALTAAFLLLAVRPPRPVRPWRGLMLALMLLSAGIGWASIYTSLQSPVLLRASMSPRPVSGTLVDIERVEKGLRFTLAEVTIKNLPPEKTPHRIRLSVRTRPDDQTPLPRVGDRVDLLAGLLPPMGPATPSGFDFARYFYFRDIGAVGYGLPPWKVTPAAQSDLYARFMQWRFGVTQHIIATLGPQRGPIAAGLVTGEARAISDRDFDALRASNLYHIIAISGGHMAVIAGVIFVSLRLLLLLLPRHLGQRPAAKSWAALVTLVMASLYLCVTGMPISAVRSYVMIALVLTAVILRREVDALRSLMLAAIIMLLHDPSDILEPGFQLSFVATLAIVALVEAAWLRPARYEEPSRLRTLGRLIASALMISLVAEAATAPLVMHMFNNFSSFGVLANALATPLVAIIIMPTVALFFILQPFGLQDIALALMDIGIRALLWVAQTISDLPHAQNFVPSPPSWGVALFVAGLLMACMLYGRIRRAGLVVMVLGVLSLLTVRLPDLLVGAEVKQIALRTPSGPMLVRGKADALLPKLWANALGYKTLPPLKPGTDPWRCDKFGCIARINNVAVSFPATALAMAEDCGHVKLMITTRRGGHCDDWVIGPYALSKTGVQAFWLQDNGYIRHETSADWQGQRPWSLNR